MFDTNTLPVQGFDRLVAVMACLRAPVGGCPWDREQTLATLRAYLVEESYELIDAIDDLGPASTSLPADFAQHGGTNLRMIAQFREELGDVLLQIAFQSQIAKELGWFDADAVATGIADKMIRRHPHVFGDLEVADSSTVLRNWEQTKRQEGKGALSGVPRNLPALLRGQRMGEKAARIGFDWQKPNEVLEKVDEELAELREAIASQDSAHIAEELGDLLFALTSLARHLEVDAEQALRGTLDKFTRRFSHVEASIEAAHGKAHRASADVLDALWREAKGLEKG